MRILRRGLAVLALLVVLAVAGAGWRFSGMVVETAEEEPLGRPVVATMDDSSIVLTGTRIGRTGATWFLEWPGGAGVAGALVGHDREQVRRRFLVTKGRVLPGDQVALGAYPFAGDPQATCGLPFAEVTVVAALGSFPAWHVPGRDSTWVVFVHGRTASRAEALRMLAVVARLGLPSLVISLRNDPGAPGSPDGLYHLGATEWEDLEAGVRFATGRGARRVILAGCSMGGAVVAEFLGRSALADSVVGVVLDAPVLDWGAVVGQGARNEGALARALVPVVKLVVSLRTGFRWDGSGERAWARQFRRPVPILLFHGDADGIVPIATSASFAEALGERVTLVRTARAGHVQSWNVDPGGYELALRRWVAAVAGDSSRAGQDAAGRDRGPRRAGPRRAE